MDEIIYTKRWLRKAIEKVASEVIGIDNAAYAVISLRERYCLKNIFYCDEQNLRTLGKESFDVVVAGEVIEHMPNPGLFF